MSAALQVSVVGIGNNRVGAILAAQDDVAFLDAYDFGVSAVTDRDDARRGTAGREIIQRALNGGKITTAVRRDHRTRGGGSGQGRLRREPPRVGVREADKPSTGRIIGLRCEISCDRK